MGKSRSVSVIIAYLKKYYNKTVNEALQFIKEKRPMANPNIGFIKQLELM